MNKIKKFFKEYVPLIIIAIVIVLLLNTFVLKTYTVNGSSMYPTLVDGDKGYGFVITKNISINRFDIVVINNEKNGEDYKLVKRVIGLPHEKVEYKDNKLYINDEYVAEDFLGDDIKTSDFVYILKEDEYFCLGDNREHSSDSRVYGPFSSSQIEATHLFIIGNFKDGISFDNVGYKN